MSAADRPEVIAFLEDAGAAHLTSLTSLDLANNPIGAEVRKIWLDLPSSKGYDRWSS